MSATDVRHRLVRDPLTVTAKEVDQLPPEERHGALDLIAEAMQRSLRPATAAPFAPFTIDPHDQKSLERFTRALLADGRHPDEIADAVQWVRDHG